MDVESEVRRRVGSQGGRNAGHHRGKSKIALHYHSTWAAWSTYLGSYTAVVRQYGPVHYHMSMGQ